MTVGQTYYIINIGSADRVKLASTPQLAEAGTAITITNSGTGTQQFNIRSRVYTGGNSVAVIESISGTQAVVAPAVSGAGRVTEITVTNEGTNYRAAPTVVFDDPYYGTIATVSIQLKLRQHILHLKHLQELLKNLLREQVQLVLNLLL